MFFSVVECFVNKIGVNVTLFIVVGLSSFVDSVYAYTGTATCLLMLHINNYKIITLEV